MPDDSPLSTQTPITGWIDALAAAGPAHRPAGPPPRSRPPWPRLSPR